MNFEEGEEYDIEEIPDSDMTNSGALEAVGGGKLAAKFGDTYVTFKKSKLTCVDVRTEEEVKKEVENAKEQP